MNICGIELIAARHIIFSGPVFWYHIFSTNVNLLSGMNDPFDPFGPAIMSSSSTPPQVLVPLFKFKEVYFSVFPYSRMLVIYTISGK